jgi:hypothetical protein
LSRKYFEHIIIGLEDPLNQHLVKLVGFDFPPEQRQHFRREIRLWLDKIQRLRLKPNNRPGPFTLYCDLLYDYPFGGVEVRGERSESALEARIPGEREPAASERLPVPLTPALSLQAGRGRASVIAMTQRLCPEALMCEDQPP